MRIDLRTETSADNFSLLVGTVAPRPIGWVSTLARDGTRNLAPFSYFGIACIQPPLLFLSVGRRQGQRKDTAQNLVDTKEAVVHIPHRSIARAMVQTSAEVEPNVDEFDLAGLPSIPSEVVQPPRVADAVIAYECVMERHLEVGDGPNDVFFLRALVAHVHEEVMSRGSTPAQRLGVVGRLGGADYSLVTDLMKIPRP
jgi:flavin reductase (DIM6/NTAB) family NADH-FMN oxidoreductase RutF